MNILTSILFAIFYTSVLVLSQEQINEVEAHRQKAIQIVNSHEQNAKEQYNMLRADFLKYNETTMKSLKAISESYRDRINQFLNKGEDELIVPGVHVFPECRRIYDELEATANSAKESFNKCTSKLLTRNTDYLRNLDQSFLSIQSNITGSRALATEVGIKSKDRVEIENTDDLINYLTYTTEEIDEHLKTQINKMLEKPYWLMDSTAELEINDCFNENLSTELHEQLQKLVKDIENCVSSKRST